MLKTVGNRLASAVRPADTLARFGGDEFALICDSVADEQVAVAIVNRLLAASSAPLAVEGAVLTVTASAGVALTAGGHGPVTTAEALLREVDTALYRAKDHGGARAELFDEGMQIQAQARLTLESELRRAVDRDELVIHYQPIRSAVDQQVIAVEALVRWQHPTRGMLAPDVFCHWPNRPASSCRWGSGCCARPADRRPIGNRPCMAPPAGSCASRSTFPHGNSRITNCLRRWRRSSRQPT